MKALIVVTMLTAAMPGGALAQGDAVPRYDPEAYCRPVASVGGNFSASTYNTCIDIEQEAYDRLKPLWAEFPGETRGYCDQVARVGGGGSYSTLGTCIEMELEAAAETPRFRF